jgi:FTR1 family protein
MFEALVITLREGVEAALVLAIALSLLERRGLSRLRGALFAGAGVALLASAAVAAAATRITWNQEVAEGIAMLVGAGLVLTLVWWMWRSAPRMKEEIESGIARATGAGSGSALGLFLFGFGMVFREGVEAAVFLSASVFNSAGVGRWLGALAGLVLAAMFGVLFARGTLKVALKPFFSLTSAVLLLIAFQLVVGGLHELSEAQVLPSSRAEMALIGPLVKNELLLFTLTVGLAGVWLLFGPGAAPGAAGAGAPAAALSGPDARLERARRAREAARRRWTGIVALMVVGLLGTAFVQRARLPGPAPAEPLTFADGLAGFDPHLLEDGRLHFFAVTLADPRGGSPRPLRFFGVRVNGEIRTCFDACEICGDKGYFEDGGAVVCRNCTSPIVLASLGQTGGCNPIPLPHALEGGRCVVRERDLAAVLPRLTGR